MVFRPPAANGQRRAEDVEDESDVFGDEAMSRVPVEEVLGARLMCTSADDTRDADGACVWAAGEVPSGHACMLDSDCAVCVQRGFFCMVGTCF